MYVGIYINMIKFQINVYLLANVLKDKQKTLKLDFVNQHVLGIIFILNNLKNVFYVLKIVYMNHHGVCVDALEDFK